MKSEKLSVIIPAYNEELIIHKNLQKIEKILKKALSNHNLSYELILVDDGSDDQTYEQGLKFKKNKSNVKIIRYTQNGGKGKALKYGFDHSTGKYIFFLDADLDISPKFIPQFINYMKETNADVVIGSKRHPDSNINYPLTRQLLSAAYQWINIGLFQLKVTDTQSGCKIFRSEVLKEIFPNVLCKKYAFDLELLVNANHRKWKIVEHPIEIDWKRAKNRLSLRDVWQMGLDTAAIFYRLKIVKHYDGPYKITTPKIHKVYDILYDVIIK